MLQRPPHTLRRAMMRCPALLTEATRVSRRPALSRHHVGCPTSRRSEVVYSGDRALWSMATPGFGAGAAQTPASIYAFCVRSPPRHRSTAVRGPAELSAEGMRYVCGWQGSLHRFHGSEHLADGRPVYELRFSGDTLARARNLAAADSLRLVSPRERLRSDVRPHCDHRHAVAATQMRASRRRASSSSSCPPE